MRFEKVPTLAYLVVLVLLCSLGTWQLSRSEEKRLFLKQQELAAASTEIITLSNYIDMNADELRYKKIQVIGHYDTAHQFLIDNQFSAGKVGYFVLTPFIIQGGTTGILVNRGWVPLNLDRTVLPDVEIKDESTVVSGRINHFPSVGVKLAGAEIPTETWPSVLQLVDVNILAKKLTYPLMPFQIELDKDQQSGFKRDWQTTTVMLPEQHIAYAIQWFALAFTLTILFIGYSFKKNDK
jgi:surfeit locus 1 family protein